MLAGVARQPPENAQFLQLFGSIWNIFSSICQMFTARAYPGTLLVPFL